MKMSGKDEAPSKVSLRAKCIMSDFTNFSVGEKKKERPIDKPGKKERKKKHRWPSSSSYSSSSVAFLSPSLLPHCSRFPLSFGLSPFPRQRLGDLSAKRGKCLSAYLLRVCFTNALCACYLVTTVYWTGEGRR